MLEHIVLHHLNEKIDDILYNRQHGFRRGLSCETQLCSTYHEIARYYDNNNTVHAVVLDFTKAFDKVPHSLLLEKLYHIKGLHPLVLHWIKDFLHERQQKVKINGMIQLEEVRSSSGLRSRTNLVPPLHQ